MHVVRVADAAADTTENITNAYLLCHDELVSNLDDRGRRLLLGTVLGRTQSELADEEGISQSAVSQKLARSGCTQYCRATNCSRRGPETWITAPVLGSIDAADLLRPAHGTSWGNRVARIAIGVVVAWLLISGSCYDWLWVAVVVAVVAAWVITTTLDRAGSWPAVGLAVLGIAGFASAPVLSTPDGWLTQWYASLPYALAHATPFERAALITAYSVFLLQSANTVERGALSTTDVRIQRSEIRIKGGRLIGPIERIFLFWMARSGQLLAIGAIVAAKGILRYPEISEREGKKSRGALAEYVLIGSLVSWGLALIVVPLLV